MIALFNNQVTNDHICSAFNDRALQFGDGLFETIKVKNGEVRLLNYHLRRLASGAKALGIKIPDYINDGELTKNILDLMRQNKIEKDANVKLMVWRGNDKQRAYASQDDHAQSLLLTRVSNGTTLKNYCSFSEEVRLHYWKLSQFKTLSALPYVVAARERDQRGLDELILLNVKKQVTECVASNIFWVKDKSFFTPSLTTGCIAGVMRSFLLDFFIKRKIAVYEVEAEEEELLEADTVFTTNSQGIQLINTIDRTTFNRIDYFNKILNISMV